MSTLNHLDRDISRLHPAIRNKVKKIRDQLHLEKIPFEVFEAFRTPGRQAVLQAKRPKVTWVGPWGSIHQYGLAVDFVLRIDGKWSWDDKGDEARYWTRLHELAKENGMTPLYNRAGKLIEKPHIQLNGISSSELRKGMYPEGGDEVWAEHLSVLIDNWTDSVPAPPKPKLAPEQPALDPSDLSELEEPSIPLTTNKAAIAIGEASASPRFQKLNSFIRRWEGGFVNHPADKGGATNMGITIRTLATWRGTEVTVEDVRDLTRAEADAIYWSNYYSICRCTEMPERMAMVVYNCAVLSGTKRAIEFMQTGFNSLGMTADGKPLAEDGILGRQTMGAVYKTDPSVLAGAFMDVQEAYLRSLDTFDVFGGGWMNRMAALREFVNTLPQGAGVRPTTQMKISDSKIDLEDILKVVTGLMGGGGRTTLSAAAGALLQPDEDANLNSAGKKALLSILLGGKSDVPAAHDPISAVNAADGKPPLTPVNAALGETIGRVVNGKKSVTGIVGLILTTLLPQLGISGDIVNFLSEHSQTLLTLFSLVTGWGFLGKIDKAIRLVGVVR